MTRSLTICKESSSWNIRPINGCRWSRWPAHWTLDPVGCTSIPYVAHIWKLRSSRHWPILYHPWCLCPHCGWLDNVWRYKVIGDLGCHPIRTDWQSRLCFTILLGHSRIKMDCRLHGATEHLCKNSGSQVIECR